jgi:hypothetical protein
MSISTAELMAVIRGCMTILAASLTNAMSRMTMPGLSCMKSYKRCVPTANPPVRRPGSSAFLAPVIAPHTTRSITPSENISLWTPRSLWLDRCLQTASGMAPIPICSGCDDDGGGYDSGGGGVSGPATPVAPQPGPIDPPMSPSGDIGGGQQQLRPSR